MKDYSNNKLEFQVLVSGFLIFLPINSFNYTHPLLRKAP